jgi:hypothetical protein
MRSCHAGELKILTRKPLPRRATVLSETSFPSHILSNLYDEYLIFSNFIVGHCGLGSKL